MQTLSVEKEYLEYEDMKQLIYDKIPELQKENFNEVVAVSRGGVSIAQIIAKELRLPMGYIFPGPERLCLYNPEAKNVLVVEDLIAQGRTTKIVHKIMKKQNINYKYMPFLMDINYPDRDFDYICMVSKRWIVFPWERFDEVQANDRGLFRNQTDQYKGHK